MGWTQKKRRVGRPQSVLAPAMLRSAKKVKKWKQWSNESAVDAVKNGESVLRVA